MHDGAVLIMCRALAALAFMVGCSTLRGTGEIRTALVCGDQERVDVFTRAFLQGKTNIDGNALRDDRLVDRSIILRVEEKRRISQYGVDRVADYFLCLLEIKARASTRMLVGIGSSDERCKQEDHCEVCNSLVVPIPDDIRDKLKQYWREQLRHASAKRVSSEVATD
jgi:hypothetical protein